MTKRPKLRTPENADRICELIAEGRTLRQVARQLGFGTESHIVEWGNDEADPAFVERYARAMACRWERMADELVEICDADCTIDGKPDNALVQQKRLQVDTRKWLLSKALPKKYGDRVTQELTTDPDGPLVTRIELVAVRSPARDLIEGDEIAIGEAAATPLRAVTSR